VKRTYRHPLPLGLIFGAAAVILAREAGVPTGILAVPAGLLVALFAPGYAALLAVRPRHLAGLPRLILSLPLSLSLVIAVGLILNVTWYGVRPRPFTLAVTGVSLALLAVGCWRARAMEIPPRERAPGRVHVRAAGEGEVVVTARISALRGAPASAAALFLGALVAAGAWTGYGMTRATREAPQPFTEFYVRAAPVTLGAPGSAGAATLYLGVTNHHDHPERYTLRVLTHRQGRAVLLASRHLHVGRGKTWAGTIPLRGTCRESIEAQLWVAPQRQPYRRVQVRLACPDGQRSDAG
jgi:uncharacterized membrane protein